jgi:hypothetical protein
MNIVAVDHRSKQSRRVRLKGTVQAKIDSGQTRPERKSRAEVNHDVRSQNVRSQNAFARTRPHRGQGTGRAASSIRL